MGGSSKNAQTTQQVTIPPDVLARYDSVNQTAQNVAQTPFQTYSTSPNAFVAPVTGTQTAGISAINAGSQAAQPYYGAATGVLGAAQAATAPYYGAATSDLTGAQQTGTGLALGSLGALGAANANADPLNSAAGSAYTGAYAGAQPYNAAALGAYGSGAAAAQPLQSAAASNITGAEGVGGALGTAALGSLAEANSASNPLQYSALGQVQSSAAGAQPYNAAATGLAAAGAGQVNATPIDASAINQFENPYLSQVLGSTASLLNQNNQQQQAGQLGNAISSGAFGGDRTGIAAANLEQQQNLANANIYSGIASNAFNTALGAAQQQQGVNLGAGQANRAALQTASGQLQSIGQQGFTQGQTAAENTAGIGSTLFGQGATTAAQQAAIGQQLSALGLSAAGQQAGLGAQEFGQGQTLGQNVQGLGQQEYAQGMGLGTAQQGLANQEFGQGAQTASQLAALGQQQFGQGATASQQAAGIGQDIYGTGAATSAALAGLGTGAQTAALQGGQAQLAAGAVQQQTQQAGDTALYNQFLQQQSYPFQTAQFLANIAEGTGALSGSTTTTTQPQSIFSDERLKEDIEPIGKTFDGQNVVRFRYKGEPTKRIGLIAQDVEKKHPEAVGLAGGYKTVDYGKATERAAGLGTAANDDHEAPRKKYAYGGYPMLPGEWPGDISALLQSGEQSPGIYGGQAGLYGSTTSATPRGGLSYVPSANLPVGHLAVAGGAPPQQQSALNQVMQISNLANQAQRAGGSLKSGLGAVESLFHPSGGDAQADLPDPSSVDGITVDPTQSTPQWRGGRSGLAVGGVPFDGDTDEGDDPTAVTGQTPIGGPGLAIPNQAPKANLALPEAAPEGSGGGGLSGVASVLGMLPMLLALKTGGRAGYDVGGATVNDPADTDEKNTLISLMRNLQQQQPQAPAGGLGVNASIPAASPTPPSPGLGAASAPSSPVNSPTIPNSPPASVLSLIAKAEGTGKNPNSSARGPYQIIDPTFVGAYRQMFPEQSAGMSKADILALRNGPQGDQLSSEMGPWLAQQNMKKLEAAGVQPSPPNVYLAHFLGPDVAVRVVQADPSSPVAPLVGPLAVAENSSILKNKTVGDVRAWAARRMQQPGQFAAGGSVRRGRADGGVDGVTQDPTSFVPPVDDSGPAGPTGLGTDPMPSPTPPVQNLSGLATQPQDPSGTPIPELSGPTPHPVTHDPDNAPLQKKGFLGDLTKPEVFIPLLAGIAGMGAAPTVHPGVAIAAGLGAAANAWQGQREYALQQQQVAQHGQEVGVYQGELALKPQEIALQRAQVQTQRMQVAMQLFGPQLQTYDANFTPLSKIGPDGLPMKMDNLHGQPISQAQYSQQRDQYISSLIGEIQGAAGSSASGPLSSTAQAVGGSNGGPVPSGVVNGAGAGAGGVGGGFGGGGAGVQPSPGAGGLPSAPGGLGQPSRSVPPSAGIGQPPPPVPNARPALPPKSVAGKVASGYYLRPPIQLPSVDDSQFVQTDSPSWLTQQGGQLIQNGDADAASTGRMYLQRAADIRDGKIIPTGVNGQPNYSYVQLAPQREQLNSVAQANAAQLNDLNAKSEAFSQEAPTLQQIYNSEAKIYQNWDTNRTSPMMADLVGAAQGLGLGQALDDKYKAFQGATDEATKLSSMQAITQMIDNHLGARAPAAIGAMESKTVPGPALSPDARYGLTVQQTAQYLWTKNFWDRWNQNAGQVTNVQGYMNDYLKENPMQNYVKYVAQNMPPFMGMTPQGIRMYRGH